jgi:hypothetical protein
MQSNARDRSTSLIKTNTLDKKEIGMSFINGDKARDNRRHKKLVKMREKREALKAKLAGAQAKKK